MGLLKLIALLIAPSLYLSYNSYDTYYIKDYSIEIGIVNEHMVTDGYFRIFNKNTQDLIKEVVFDSGDNDNFKYLADVGDEFFLIVDEVMSKGDLEIEQYTLILKYNLDGNLIDTLSIEETPRAYFNINDILIVELSDRYLYIDQNLNLISDCGIDAFYLGEFSLNYHGNAKVNGEEYAFKKITYPGNYEIEIIDNNSTYNFALTIEADFKIEGEKQGETFLSPVVIYSFGDLSVNGEIYLPGDLFNSVGNNTLVINGIGDYKKTIDFIIEPDTTVFDGEDYVIITDNFNCDYPVHIYTNGLNMEINDKSYNSELIDTPGIYNLKVTGVNGYEKHNRIVIWPKIEDLSDTKEYDKLSISVFGTAKINDKEISGNYVITEVGDYKLELLMEDKVWKTYYFSIVEKEESNQVDIAFIKYIFLGLTALGLFLFLRKK